MSSDADRQNRRDVRDGGRDAAFEERQIETHRRRQQPDRDEVDGPDGDAVKQGDRVAAWFIEGAAAQLLARAQAVRPEAIPDRGRPAGGGPSECECGRGAKADRADEDEPTERLELRGGCAGRKKHAEQTRAQREESDEAHHPVHREARQRRGLLLGKRAQHINGTRGIPAHSAQQEGVVEPSDPTHRLSPAMADPEVLRAQQHVPAQAVQRVRGGGAGEAPGGEIPAQRRVDGSECGPVDQTEEKPDKPHGQECAQGAPGRALQERVQGANHGRDGEGRMQRGEARRQWLILRRGLGGGHRGLVQTEEYLRLADVEDRHWYFRSLHAHARRELLARHAADSPVDVLDAGCGTGGFIGRLMPTLPRWRWSGLDFMPLACRLAQQRLPAALIREGSVTALPFPAEGFDAVTLLDVISQVSYPDEAQRAFSECSRVLRPGGTLVLNVAAYRWLWSYHDDACHTRHRFAAGELRQLAREAGFDVRRLTHWNALTFPLVVARRKLFARSEGSDVRAAPSVVDRAMDGVMSLEHAWLRRGGRWAWGSSLLLVATRR